MTEETKNYIRIPVIGEEASHEGCKVRSVIVSGKEAIKGLYCLKHKKMITYIFAKSNEWTEQTAREWKNENEKKYSDLEEMGVDQEPEFMKLFYKVADEVVGNLSPSSPSFILDEEIHDFTTGIDKMYENGKFAEIVDTKEDGSYYKFRVKDVLHFKQDTLKIIDVSDSIQAVCGQLINKASTSIQSYLFKSEAGTIEDAHTFLENRNVEYIDCCQCEVQEKIMEDPQIVVEHEIKSQFTQLELIKVDKTKHIVYGLFLVPEKADHDGDVISELDIEKVAHGFLADYRAIDEMHKEVISADIVESAIAWEDGLKYYGKELKKGTWFGAIKIHDKDVWDKVKGGTYKGFSVRISGVRELIEEGK